jgi:hypothetical protein
MEGEEKGGVVTMANMMMIDRPKMVVHASQPPRPFVIFSFWAMPAHVVADTKLWHQYLWPVEETTVEIRETSYVRLSQTRGGGKRLPIFIDTFTGEAMHGCQMAFEIEAKGLGVACVHLTVADKEAFKAKCLEIEHKLPKAPTPP